MLRKVGMPAGSPQRFDRKLTNGLAIAGLASALGACAVDLNLSDLNVGNKISNLSPSSLSFQGGRDFSLRPITQEDLIGPQGQCSGSAGPSMAAVDAEGQPATPALM